MANTWESRELAEARRSLAIFERNPNTPAGLAALARAVGTLEDLCQSSSDEREQKVARNHIATYAGKAEKQADWFLANFDTIPDDDVDHLLKVMREFEQASALPDSFRAKQNDLNDRLLRRWVAQLSPYQLQKLAEELRDQPGE